MRMRRREALIIATLAIIPLVAAWLYWARFGLPAVPTSAAEGVAAPVGFPLWLRLCHYANFLFITVLLRSGVQILMDHPRLYWTRHCTPGSEWLRFTPVDVPTDRMYTAKEDARYLSPYIGLPGGRHTLGLSRHWHFGVVIFWVANGALFYALLFATGEWRRIVPTDWRIVPDAWAVFVHYATLHLPPEPDGFYRYNALQQLAYFSAVFVLAPISIVTGPSMSPALVNRFRWYRHLPGNRQIGRSIHFIVAFAWLGFIAVHVAMVVITGLARNMNHIVLGTDDRQWLGAALGGVGIAVVVVINWLANVASHKRPRTVQHVGEAVFNPVQRLFLSRHAPQAEYTRDDISPYFWPNGKLPTTEEWKALAANDFRDYRLPVFGLVENPVTLSLQDMRAMVVKTRITMHNCIQGWSGIAAWTGLPIVSLMELVKPRPEAKAVVFYSFGEGGEGGQYYDSHTMEDVSYPQSLLAYEMNYAPLNHVHGAPLRLRVENQLGFKQVKWISAIEFVDSVKRIYKGEGGYNEDHEFYNSMADI